MAFLLHKHEYPLRIVPIEKLTLDGANKMLAIYADSWNVKEYVRMYDTYSPSSEVPARRLGELRNQVKHHLSRGDATFGV